MYALVPTESRNLSMSTLSVHDFATYSRFARYVFSESLLSLFSTPSTLTPPFDTTPTFDKRSQEIEWNNQLSHRVLEESRLIRSHAALSASLNLFWTCWTQSRPVTSSLAKINGSFSSRAASNSCRACFFKRTFHGTPCSSHQWKCFAVRRISRYKLNASNRWDAYRLAFVTFGIQTCGDPPMDDGGFGGIITAVMLLSMGVKTSGKYG